MSSHTIPSAPPPVCDTASVCPALLGWLSELCGDSVVVE